MTTDFPAATILGYPRIGPGRELKHALESYWAGRTGRAALEEAGRRLRAQTWARLHELGLRAPGALPSNTFSQYDHVLDAAVAVGAVPERYRGAADPYFAMARGADGLPPLRMTKWFDTNYHYIVPEIGPRTAFAASPDKPLAELAEARALGHATRPVLLGPVTLLRLARAAPGAPGGFSPLDRLDDLLDVYGELLSALAPHAAWVQLDEPIAVVDGGSPALRHAYRRLAALTARPRLLVATYFGDAGDALPALAVAPVDGIAVDLTHGVPRNLGLFEGRTIVGGVVSGRDVWRTDPDAARALLAAAGATAVGTSCSLLHVPYTLRGESALPESSKAASPESSEPASPESSKAASPESSEPAGRESSKAGLPEGLAFAEEKVAEVVSLAALGPKEGPLPQRPRAAGTLGVESRAPYAAREQAQRDLGLPPLPVTTIGSFPQTGELRAARAAVAAGRLPLAGYEARIEEEIARVIAEQEALGLDVLVHGEPERNDMVQYFAEHLDGFAVTRNGWVQSYGSRCTRPPILHGDVRRPAPITVRWATHAQSLTARPVKGMLTGPVTIVAWSFVRPDLPLRDVTLQVADAVREEVRDLQAAGIRIIQVDEPALRELLPLRKEEQEEYLAWAVAAYRRATSAASPGTQIHTHLCYSDAAEVLSAVDALDADVTSIEAARSAFAVAGFDRGIGPGVYDIHSPRVPERDEIESRLRAALATIHPSRLWVNPDCGLKTRTYDEVRAALSNVVAAAGAVRQSVR
ncbi:5-methyltetrahydropteroyltriglutamate--homocysteine S-methyltransferase [Dactylosporangium salmoneum]|uniref:5-methyltetrahydropteroyltriglutamate-- homocysteine S-methyltransferase n=1 Tax=Dactylosporangium salmoneum TaxID=53361 RepID=UPI0031D7E094